MLADFLPVLRSLLGMLFEKNARCFINLLVALREPLAKFRSNLSNFEVAPCRIDN
jgi:hypothetical protein